MKSLLRCFALLALCSAGALPVAHADVSPGPIDPPVAIRNSEGMRALLYTLVGEHEQQLPLDLYLDHLTVCKTSGESLVCDFNYTQDRWNGRTVLTFAVSNGAVTRLTAATFDGQY